MIVFIVESDAAGICGVYSLASQAIAKAERMAALEFPLLYRTGNRIWNDGELRLFGNHSTARPEGEVVAIVTAFELDGDLTTPADK